MGDPINLEKLLKYAFQILDGFWPLIVIMLAMILGLIFATELLVQIKRVFSYGLWDRGPGDEYDGTYNADWEAEKERHGWK